MKTKTLMIFVLMFNIIGALYSQETKSNKYFTLEIDYSPVLVYQFENSVDADVNNDYNFLAGLKINYEIERQYFIYHFSTGFMYNTKDFSVNYLDSKTIIKKDQDYSFFKIPFLFGVSYKLNNYSIGIGTGVMLNYFNEHKCISYYTDGNISGLFPSDLEFNPFGEIYYNLNVSYTFPNKRISVAIQPYVLQNLSNPLFYSNSFYNRGKLSYGINIVFKLKVNKNKLEDEK